MPPDKQPNRKPSVDEEHKGRKAGQAGNKNLGKAHRPFQRVFRKLFYDEQGYTPEKEQQKDTEAEPHCDQLEHNFVVNVKEMPAATEGALPISG